MPRRWADCQLRGHIKCEQSIIHKPPQGHGISDATFYKWRSKFGGMDISDARKLKALEEENCKLKKLLAETVLDAATLKEMLGKNF